MQYPVIFSWNHRDTLQSFTTPLKAACLQATPATIPTKFDRRCDNSQSQADAPATIAKYQNRAS